MLKFTIDIVDLKTLLLIPEDGLPDDVYNVQLELFRAIPERRWTNNGVYRGWTVPATKDNIEYITAKWREGDDYVTSETAKMLLKLEELTELVDTKKSKKRWEYLFEGKRSDFNVPAPRKPMDHQRVAVEAMYGAEYFGLLMEMGTGKTQCICNEVGLYAMNMRGNEMFRAIVVCPKSLMINWYRELMANTPDIINTSIEILNKGDDKAVEQLMKLILCPSRVKILIVSYMSVGTLLGRLLAFKPQYTVFDESQYAKNPEAKLSKACKELASNSGMRRILTGTVVSNTILDVWHQFELLRPGCLGYGTFSGFKRQYCKLQKTGEFEKITGYQNVDRLKENMARMSFTVKKEQCIDLPARTYETIEISLPDNIRAVYDQFAMEFYVSLENGTEVKTEFILVQMLKLSQICSGYAVSQTVAEYDEEGNPKEIENITTPLANGNYKLDQMIDDAVDVLNESKLIVWARFKHDIDAICANFMARGFECAPFYSKTSQKDRQTIIDRFNNDPTYRIFVGNPGAGGVGLTLLGGPGEDPVNRVKNCFYYNNDFSYNKRDQSEARCHRIGLRNPVLYRDYVASNTIETYIATKLQQKKDLAECVKNVGEIKELLLSQRES